MKIIESFFKRKKMKFKKTLLFLILFTGILGCECFNAGSKWNIDSFNVSIYDKQYKAPVDGVIEGDSVQLEIIFEAEFVDISTNPLSVILSSAYATSCESPGDDGLKDKIKNFVVTSDSDFNGIKFGEPLNGILTNESGESIDDWISNSDSWDYSNFRRIYLMFIEKPEPLSSHIFTIKFIMESGNTIEQKTEEIQWN
jgi:hypothetical protein